MGQLPSSHGLLELHFMEFDRSEIEGRAGLIPILFEPAFAFRGAEVPLGTSLRDIRARDQARDLGIYMVHTTLDHLGEPCYVNEGIAAVDGRPWDVLSLAMRSADEFDELGATLSRDLRGMRSVFQKNHWEVSTGFDQFWPQLGRVAIVDWTE